MTSCFDSSLDGSKVDWMRLMKLVKSMNRPWTP